MTLREQFLSGTGCPVIDSHGHLGPFCGIYMPEARLDTMIAGMDRCGVECLILSPHNALSGDTRGAIGRPVSRRGDHLLASRVPRTAREGNPVRLVGCRKFGQWASRYG